MTQAARVYLVDDHAMVRQGLRALLTEAGHEVVGDSGDITAALADLQQLAPDIVLVDLSIGPRSGMELLTELQRRHLSVRPLVLTMSAQPRHVGMALKLGACGYVLKGSPSEELLQAIEALRAGRRHLGQGVAELAARALAEGAGDDPFATLSVRERQVVIMVVDGHSSTEIATALHLSPKTVDSYRSRLMAKLGAPDVTALVKLAIRHGLVNNDA
ncbi:DNA-binding NarL/FixJ family response regulator [Pelomonas saccharophila]|uniref:DNA-binding NarL/FixJ family response regulator n=1 Tax=Roseateles saccharophilus TaxID=304 RepID=A0ABU1YLX6_ROSSA|nr:response regulator transcription factor [Roseateles saccharophilus]MDR7269225.1 DNA-binding NarL/FixJ family response regulator [Roseateles saccharophilus]